MKDIAILLLAAGKSSRMNGIKQLLKVNHKTLLEITIDKVKALKNSTVFCVLGANANRIQKEINTNELKYIINPNYNEGLSSSIIAGLRHVNTNAHSYKGLFIILADQPAISSTYLAKMIAIFNNNTSKIVASNYQGKAGVPAIFPYIYFKKLLKITGDKGAKELLKKNEKDIIFCNLPTNLVDIDTPEDYLNYLNSI
ncbi:nucleotidyltransferase family protein [uncultured Polaribacter sp.]|uniref:nucleotidyltransferase family protein n=1 Tax=uncultured Polaribacter sp. TaxID=174711 RepID=UPI002604DA7F|nr:nucleotidyltransferase family protein [uncultured Polaribacter sp.]